MENKLKEAQAQYEANPKNADAIIWVGRRLAYLGRFMEAIDTYTKGIELFPADARFYRHRGHRQITLRQFDLAIADLKKARSWSKASLTKSNPTASPTRETFPPAHYSSISGITSDLLTT